MADAEPNQDFPSRAALRRARRAEEEAKRQTGQREQQAARRLEDQELDAAQEFDEFDAIAESRAEDSDAEANGWVVPVTVDEPASASSAETATGPAEDPATDPHPKSAVLRRLTAQAGAGAKAAASASSAGSAKTAAATPAPASGAGVAKAAARESGTGSAKTRQAASTTGAAVATLAADRPSPDAATVPPAATDRPANTGKAPARDARARDARARDAGATDAGATDARGTEAPVIREVPSGVVPQQGDATGRKASSGAVPPQDGAAVQHAAQEAEDLSTPEARRQALRTLGAIENRETFLRPDEEPHAPAERGFRGLLARMGFNVEPTEEEVQERRWRRAVGTRLAAPRTVSVVNGKGGANKTPTAVLLAAVFGRHGADPVLAWDNNGTRGTLGWRTAKAAHDAHVMDLLRAAPDLMDTRVGDPVINDYVHHQPEDRFSVLRTDPTLLASEQHLTAGDFDTLHAVVEKFFRLAVVDSGNDESAERWMRMIDRTDQLVIATTTVEEHAEAGALLLEALAKRGGRYAELARNAVVVVSQQQQRGSKEQLGRIALGFRRLARAVVTVPYDPALVKGPIRFEALRPGTRHAWLEAAAAVAAGLED